MKPQTSINLTDVFNFIGYNFQIMLGFMKSNVFVPLRNIYSKAKAKSMS